MLYLINIVKGKSQVRDPEGAEFADLQAARLEAEQTARDLAAEELRSGKPVPADWTVEVTDHIGNVVATIPFSSLMVAPHATRARVKPTTASVAQLNETVQDQYRVFLEHHRRAREAFLESSKVRAEIRVGFTQLWRQLAAVR
jgi:glucose-6-phosphate-specific signal transduction histidine kinase